MNTNFPKCFAPCLVLILLPAIAPSYAQGPAAWHWRNPLPQGDELRSVAQGNGTFVAVGERGRVFKSPDGVVWSQQPSLTNSIFDVTFANGLFVAVGGEFTPTTSFSGDIYTSPDGVHWTKRDSDTTEPLTGIVFGAGHFVAVGPRLVCSVSSDGQTWASHPGPRANAITFRADSFVTAGENGNISTSIDGINWISRPSGTTENLYDVAFGRGLFVVVGANGTVLASNFTETWTAYPSGTTATLRSIAFMNEAFVAAGDGGTILTSALGDTWTRRDSGETVNLLGVGGSDGIFVVVGTSGMIVTSPDGVAWDRRTVAVTVADLNDVTAGNAGFVAVGETGALVTSPNGLSWSVQRSGVSNDLFRIAFANDRFVTVGSAGSILTSSNAVDWQQRVSGSSRDLRGIAFGNGMFVAVGDGGTILVSTTGDSWTPRDPGTTSDLLSVAFGHGVFVTTGPRAANFMVSSNGSDWTAGDSILPVAYHDVAFGRRTFLAVGDSSTHNPFYIFQQSTNGWDWNFGPVAVDGDGRHELMGVTYGDNMFVAVGRVGTVLASIDEQRFYEGDSGTAVSLRGVGFGNGTFVAVGGGGAILQSDPMILLNFARNNSSTAITLWGTPGNSYRIEGTGQLGPDAVWQTLTNIMLETNPTLWTDPQALQQHSFYRASANDNLIANGGFESPGFNAPPDYRYLSSTESFSPTLGIDLTGWIARDDRIGEPPYLAKLPGSTNEVHRGDYAVLLNQGSAITTTFPTQRDRAYTLTFWLRPADAADNIPPDPLRVRIAGLATTFPTIQGWTQRTFHFTAPSTDTAAPLEFFNDSPVGDWRVWNLDDVMVKADL
jgi:hypothetical protein